MIWAVVPTCGSFIIPEQTVPVRWIIVHDREQRPVYELVDSDLVHIVAPDPTLFGQGSDSIRSAGFLHAYLHGAPGDVILTVDDDCTIPKNWAEQHQEALSLEVRAWSLTVPDLYTRGTIRDTRPVAISHGLWDGVPDVYATDQDDRLWEMPRRVTPIHRGISKSRNSGEIDN